MQQERILQLLSRKFAGEATPRELEELEQLMQQSQEWRTLAAQFPQHRPPDNDDDLEAKSAYAAHAVKMQLSGRMDQPSSIPSYSSVTPKPSNRNVKLGAVLASSLVLLALGVIYIGKKGPVAVLAKNEVVTRKGTTSTIKLPDGTKVWLNADSKLEYPETFDGKMREVTLTGEAYFDVSKDSIRPFIIHTDKINIQVLGTAFNVKSYPQDELVETSLIHGKIAVTFNDRPTERIVLKPNEKLVLRKDQAVVLNTLDTQQPKVQVNNIRVMPGNLVQETAWMQNKMVFSDMTFGAIAAVLERKFNVRFVFENEEVKGYTYTGIYENESLDEILEVLRLSKKFSYNKTNNEIRINH